MTRPKRLWTRKTPRPRPGNTVRFEIEGRTFVGVVKSRRKEKFTVESNGLLVTINHGDITSILRSSLK